MSDCACCPAPPCRYELKAPPIGDGRPGRWADLDSRIVSDPMVSLRPEDLHNARLAIAGQVAGEGGGPEELRVMLEALGIGPELPAAGDFDGVAVAPHDLGLPDAEVAS